LGYALAKLFDIPHSDIDYSLLARLGSGSACRSIYGGFVIWDKENNSLARKFEFEEENWWLDNL
jgi:diphosphomevalonate decarboxylase